MSKLTHLDDSGAAQMVDIADKQATQRQAVATGKITMSAEALKAIRDGMIKKGDVLATARIAGIMAAKKTSDLIPLCHPLALSKVAIDFEFEEGGIHVSALAKLTGQTGVEMEALTAASVALLTIYDMAKAIDKGMEVSGIRLLEKSGGEIGRLDRRRMITLEEAQERLLKLAVPLREEIISLTEATGRYLANDIFAKRTQPAKDMSAMDGYAIAHEEFSGPWEVIGEAAAGGNFEGEVVAGEAVRIFTGAPLPLGTDSILIQENAANDAGKLSPNADVTLEKGQHVRRIGSDFFKGDLLIDAGTRLNAAHIGLAAMAGYADLPLHRLPHVAIFQTGDELVEAGRPIGEDQIPASNGPMLAAMLADLPCNIVENRILPDDLEATKAAIAGTDADVIVTIGGASVGDHDLVRPALEAIGAKLDFWKVAIRPGKPVMAGKVDDAVILGLPGNPVSAYVTAFLFLLPLLRHMAGSRQPLPTGKKTQVNAPLPTNGTRAYFIRAIAKDGVIKPLPSQDSAILASLSRANALIYRPVSASACVKNEQVEYFTLD